MIISLFFLLSSLEKKYLKKEIKNISRYVLYKKLL